MRKILLLSLVLFVCRIGTMAQNDTIPDTKTKIKKGWTLAALPVVGYDADLGFQYGALANVFDYGDGSTYPEYRSSIYVEWSRYTRGSGVNQLFYDSKYLIPGHIRVTADITYLTDRALPFYGFNGYEAAYHPGFEEQGADDYISRVFYRHDRKMLRIMADFQGPILGNRFRWLAGLNFFGYKIATVNIDRLNRGKSEDDKLPDVPLLYDDYVRYGFITEKEKDGGNTFYFKVGLIYDTRDMEAAPNRGMWSEVLLLGAPSFMGNKEFQFARLAVIHRQYFTLVKQKLVLACRLGYQGTIAGDAPFYILPYMYSSFSLTTLTDGLGGARNLRGILRNRIVGDGVAYGNLELRWKLFRTFLFKQNFYLGLTFFGDAGRVVQDHFIDKGNLPSDFDYGKYFDTSSDGMHYSYGAGLRAALNENFILSIDYGLAVDRRDGTGGLYVGISNLF